MSFKSTGSLFVTGCLIFAFSGCQAGKLNMPKLAFWKKDEGLESKYIEPPSHQLTPSETKIAANGDDKDLPPLPPDIDRTVDSFEKEVTRSYEQLTQQTREAQDRFADSIRQVEKDALSSTSAAVPSRPSYSSQISKPDFSNPLTPNPVQRPNTQMAQAGMGTVPPSSTGTFRPQPKPLTANPGLTEYEKIAQQEASAIKKPQAKLPEIKYPTSNSPLKPNEQVARSDGAVNNPYASGRSSSSGLQTKPATGQMTAENTNPQQTNYDYPTTPYQSYDSANPAQSNQFVSTGPTNNGSPLKPSTSPPAAAATPPVAKPSSGMKLNLAGQGSYAPGSIRKPNALNPNQLKLPSQSASASTADSSTNSSDLPLGGGSFKR